jgi:hypothetical protein
MCRSGFSSRQVCLDALAWFPRVPANSLALVGCREDGDLSCEL